MIQRPADSQMELDRCWSRAPAVSLMCWKLILTRNWTIVTDLERPSLLLNDHLATSLGPERSRCFYRIFFVFLFLFFDLRSIFFFREENLDTYPIRSSIVAFSVNQAT
jgi:hypothetical protein